GMNDSDDLDDLKSPEKIRHKGPPPRGDIGPRVNCLSKMIRQAFNEAVSEQGLFAGQQDIVLLLAENEGITLSELAKRLDISAATASVSIKRMEKAGFIIKKADKSDARVTRLYPTEKAKSAPEKIKAKMDALDAVITGGMTEDEHLLLSDLLDIAINNMFERGESHG
ncbi:MAG: MarR family transcriptional regulator, partial [Clostridiales bacterium]|nr:MarR family transcriptional regulator [Clostridiales bacterium]